MWSQLQVYGIADPDYKVVEIIIVEGQMHSRASK